MSERGDKLIGVLMGGWSQEREISLKSGRAVLRALENLGYRCVGIDVAPNIGEQLRQYPLDAVYIALHGRYGEDGVIQSLLEIQQIPYTSSSVLTSALAMDKYLSKELVRAQDFRTPNYWIFNKDLDDLDDFINNFSGNFPLMIKPSREGSSYGILKVNSQKELKTAMLESLKFDSRILLEAWIKGREVTVAVLTGEALPIVEIVTEHEFYDYEAKYTPGKTQFHCPAELNAKTTQHLKETAQKIYQHFSCEGLARVDFMLSDSGEAYFLEVNTIPGMTELSLAPRAAKAAGLSFEDLVDKVLQKARLKLI